MSTFGSSTYGAGVYGGIPSAEPASQLPTRARVHRTGTRALVAAQSSAATVRPATSTAAHVAPQRSRARVQATGTSVSVHANPATGATVLRNRKSRAEITHG
jgi:hypothetical protein